VCLVEAKRQLRYASLLHVVRGHLPKQHRAFGQFGPVGKSYLLLEPSANCTTGLIFVGIQTVNQDGTRRFHQCGFMMAGNGRLRTLHTLIGCILGIDKKW
jgi:hypothetical protein